MLAYAPECLNQSGNVVLQGMPKEKRPCTSHVSTFSDVSPSFTRCDPGNRNESGPTARRGTRASSRQIRAAFLDLHDRQVIARQGSCPVDRVVAADSLDNHRIRAHPPNRRVACGRRRCRCADPDFN